ncbi:hypothetical protein B9Y88_23295 [Stenotrophomonas maltophilia]|nr:hypothetical protein B7H26_01615 [Stenotrophomonas maltophilia]KDE91948.1 hypothetical protein DF40_015970 [Stenotrophomonas maltophilia M30]KOO85482.1 hypothetical protein VL21_03755 [Stenotrophomonas maltophilia]KOQ64994.1 hypothetical protein ABW41_03060 [Stenotrophomonas maltophilia]MBA0458573.1 hypothetical protein [Stenotrophomonas maltophilia]
MFELLPRGSTLTDQYVGQCRIVRGQSEYNLSTVDRRGPVREGVRGIRPRWILRRSLPDDFFERDARWRDIEGQLRLRRIIDSTSQCDVPNFKAAQHSTFCGSLVSQALPSRFSKMRVKLFVQCIDIAKTHIGQSLDAVLESLHTSFTP